MRFPNVDEPYPGAAKLTDTHIIHGTTVYLPVHEWLIFSGDECSVNVGKYTPMDWSDSKLLQGFPLFSPSKNGGKTTNPIFGSTCSWMPCMDLPNLSDRDDVLFAKCVLFRLAWKHHAVDGWNPARKPPEMVLKPVANNGMNYQPQLVSWISSINSSNSWVPRISQVPPMLSSRLPRKVVNFLVKGGRV